MSSQESFAGIRKGSLALPYKYFAGKKGSRFLHALERRNVILGLRCSSCGAVHVPPEATCFRCFARLREEFIELPSRGRVEGFTVVRYPSRHLPLEPPFILARIRVDGADTQICHIVSGISPEEMATDLAVRPVFSDKSEDTLMNIRFFEPLP